MIILGTVVLGCILNVIKESKLDNLSVPWMQTRLTVGLGAQTGRMVLPSEAMATKPLNPTMLDEPIFTKAFELLPPFQATLVLGCINFALTRYQMNVVTTAPQAENNQLQHGIVVQSVYTLLKNGSSTVAVVVNMSWVVTIPKGTIFAWAVTTNEVPKPLIHPCTLEQLDKMDGITWPQLSKEERYQLLLEKLDLSGLELWPSKPRC